MIVSFSTVETTGSFQRLLNIFWDYIDIGGERERERERERDRDRETERDRDRDRDRQTDRE